MKPRLIITRADWVALCLVVLCVTPYGCKDSASVSDKPDVPLASLSVTPATLLPAFSSEATSYTAQAPTTATSVTVTATPQDSTVTVSIDGTIGTQRSIALDQPGSTKTIPIVLTTQTGTDSTYSVRVTRLLSGDNNLKTLTVTPGSLSPLFDPTKPDYTLDVATNISTVAIAATKADPGAVLSGTVSNDGRATIQLDGPGTSKAVSIIVTAPNGESKTYRITINRAASSNNNLSALRVQVGTADQTLSPGFTSGETNYRVDVGTTVTSITITATKADPLAVISGGIPNESQATIPLDGPGTSKVVLITVTAQDATTSKIYRITVNRAASSNNNLSALSITPGPLEPLFAANTLDYTVTVAHTISAVVISATKEDPNAVISGSVPNEGQATIPLDGPGTSKVVLITVTAQDATTSKTYRVTVNRRASNDSSLSALTVSAGTLDPPFASNILNYTVQVGLLVGGVTISATKTDPNATMSSLGSVIAAPGNPTGQVTVAPGLGIGVPVDIQVIAQDGINTTTHRITVNRGLF
ncbi:hypothetical protein COMA1_20493 [Candidatus Nitrospira nitrosa]|uniref:Cadherin-like beta-sandwich-like domain-containing protein n=1 Tax=Candidatus Nitrospira nitrosa TaxID=1742972 RepID=A0A0S4LLA0_9BACT|nr:cadherin-like beta sandwich domain-containing protein [Candidatus Nitrospira nitrosa]CUS35874.1 hypothetical protein COMA1_20493 [Candidatus Nitrospira nitrosa]